MERFKLPDDQPMEAKILSNQVENAQKKVEEQNFVSRKNVLKYDDVMSKQRVVIYAQRRKVLEGEDLGEEVRLWIREVVERVVDAHTQAEYAEEWDLEALVNAMGALYESEITAAELREEVGRERNALVEEFVEDALDEYTAREERFGSDPETGRPIMRELERFVILQVVDTRWREHLENMDYLREGVHLRAFAQKDPLVEYTAEGHAMFEELNGAIREEVVFTLFHAEIAPQDAAELEAAAAQDGQGNGRLQYEHTTTAGADAIAAAGATATATAVGGGGGGATTTLPKAPTAPQTVVASPHEKLGRNDPCWCGSGKKFKKCHGA
jgi:preprotein translocase subunit SecA